MLLNSVSREQRFRSSSSCCPICGGWDNDRLRGHGARCYGFISNDQEWAFCTRSELAGGLQARGGSGAYLHKLRGECECGATHSQAPELIYRHDYNRNARYTGSEAPRGVVDRYYVYQDELSLPLHRTVRFRDPKSFRQQRYAGGDWQWGLGDCRRVLYQLPALLRASLDETVLLPEGEKDCDRLTALGFLATTSGGSTSWRESFSAYLRRRDILLIEDNDRDGRKRTDRLIEALAPVARRVRVVSFPGTETGYDVADYLDDGFEFAKLESKAYTALVSRLVF